MGHSESISALFCFTCASSFASLIKVYLSCLYLCPCLLFEWSLFCYPHETKRNFTEIRLLSGLKQLENHLLKLYFVPTWGGRGGGINWSLSRTHPPFVSHFQEILYFMAQILAIVFLLGLTCVACLQSCVVLVLGLIYLLYHVSTWYVSTVASSSVLLPLVKHSILRCTTAEVEHSINTLRTTCNTQRVITHSIFHCLFMNFAKWLTISAYTVIFSDLLSL